MGVYMLPGTVCVCGLLTGTVHCYRTQNIVETDTRRGAGRTIERHESCPETKGDSQRDFKDIILYLRSLGAYRKTAREPPRERLQTEIDRWTEGLGDSKR